MVNSKKNPSIGSGNTKERKEEKETCTHKNHVLIDPGVYTGQRQHGWYITEELIDSPGPAVREMEGIDRVCQRVDRPQNPRSYDHFHAHHFTHADGIMEGVADGHITVIGHGGQE